jgi:hypothetical protein
LRSRWSKVVRRRRSTWLATTGARAATASLAGSRAVDPRFIPSSTASRAHLGVLAHALSRCCLPLVTSRCAGSWSSARVRSTVGSALALRPGCSAQTRLPPTAHLRHAGVKSGVLVLTAGPVSYLYRRHRRLVRREWRPLQTTLLRGGGRAGPRGTASFGTYSGHAPSESADFTERSRSKSSRFAATERRRSRTFQAPGCDALPVLKTGWATRPLPLRAQG